MERGVGTVSEGKVIYIADDEPEILNLLREALEAKGHEIRAFSSGDALLEALDGGSPDLILLDINMPGRSGWEVQTILSKRPDTRDVPVIAVTAQGGSSIEHSARETLGFTDFLRKPFRMADLWETVDAAFQDT